MKTTPPLRSKLAVTAAVLALASQQSQSAVVQTVLLNAAIDGTNPTNSYTASNIDLLQMANVTVSTVGYSAFSGGGFTFGTPGTVLRDGSVGGATTNASDYPTSVLEVSGADPQFTVTFNLDLTGAANGYDISSIISYSGWGDSRASQLHDILISTVGDSGFSTLLNNATTGGLASGGARLTISENTTGILATNVDAIQFVMHPGGAGGHVYREIDAFGVASVPEPSAAMFGGLGLLALLHRRRA